MRLLPLLAGRFELGDLRLEGPSLRLIVDSNGRGNWSDLAGDGGTSPDDGRRISIGDLVVAGGRISIEDRQSDRSVVIRDLDLETGPFAFGRSVPIEMSLLLEFGDVTTRAALATSLTIAAQSVEFDLEEPRIDFELLDPALGLTGLTARLRAAHARLTSDAGLLESLTLEAQPRLEGWPDGLPVRLEATRLLGDLVAQTGHVEMLALDVAGATIEAPQLHAERLLDEPQIDGAVRLASIDLRGWLQRLGVEVPVRDPTTLGRIELAGRLALNSERVALEDLELELDATRATGRLAVCGFDPLRLRFDLAADEIDLDRYLPPQESGAPPGEIPVAWLRELDVAGELRIARARIADVDVDAVHLVLESGDRAVRVPQAVATLESGAGRPAS
jgi:AsmA protein